MSDSIYGVEFKGYDLLKLYTNATIKWRESCKIEKITLGDNIPDEACVQIFNILKPYLVEEGA